MIMNGRSSSLKIFTVNHNLDAQFEMKIRLISSEDKILENANCITEIDRVKVIVGWEEKFLRKVTLE